MLVHDIIPVSKRSKTAQGFLLVPAAFSRAGIHDYRAKQIGITDRDPDDIVKVYRPEDEVFSDASMASFGRVPVTNEHPRGDGVVTLDNVDSLSVGMSDEDVVREGDLMRGKLLITNRKAIADIEGGKTQLSNGYHTDIEIGAGTTPAGEHFDAIQRNILGNHIAIVARGRGGARVSIADKGDGTVKLTLDGKEYEVDQAVADALRKSQKDTEAALKLATDAEEESEKKKKEKEAKDIEIEKRNKRENPDLNPKKVSDSALATEVETLKAKLDTALEQIPTTDQLDERADARATVLDTARRLVSDIDTSGKSNEAIRKEVVEKLCANVKDRSDDYNLARFDQLAEGGGEARRFAERNLMGPAVTDADLDARKNARAGYVTNLQDAWKPKEVASA
ncbi:MAG: DUF2213 domain-containing protein [Nannocystaceae bacterium]